MPVQPAHIPTIRFNHEDSGVITICNGVKELVFMTPDEFKAIEPKYDPPSFPGYMRAYECRVLPDGTQELAIHCETGAIYRDSENDGKPALWAEGEAYIANLDVYEKLQAVREHVLFGVVDLDAAKEIASQALVNHMRILTYDIAGNKYSEDERASWAIQLAEATAWSTNSLAQTPFLDLIIKTGETKNDQVRTILAKSVELQQKIAPYIKARREKTDTLSGLSTIADVKDFYDNQIEFGWPS